MKQYEQILLAVLGFVIGFVTAFIAFGLLDRNDNESIAPRVADEYGLVATVGEQDREGLIDAPIIDNVGLFAKMGSRNRVVSAAALAQSEDSYGYHYAVWGVLVSPNHRYLYYCAQLHAEDTQCSSYIYDAAHDVSYALKDAETDEPLLADISTLSVSWLPDNRISINGSVSRSSEQVALVE